MDVKAADEWRFRADGKSFSVPVEARFEAGSGTVIKAATLAGIGISVQPAFAVQDELQSGELVQLLEPFTFVRLAVHAVYPSAGPLPVTVRAFADELSAHLRVRARDR